jgi:hypothetical protein
VPPKEIGPMDHDDDRGPLDKLKHALGRDSGGDDADPIELETLSLTDTTESDRVDTPPGTGAGGDELPPDERDRGVVAPG